jgi:hypothetical protein
MSSRIRACTIALLLLIHAGGAHAQWWTFEGRRYYDPLVAGVREAHVSAVALGFADRMDFQVEPDEWRRVWDIDVGAELPIFGWESGPGAGARVGAGSFGAGLWFGVGFHMIEDFVDASNPIINTDYRFGGIGKAQYGLSATRWVSGRLLLGHESTHLGDEFSLAGQETYPGAFERINVSWEYIDFSVRYEQQNRWSTRAASVGLTSTLPPDDSYYSVDASSATRSPIGPVVESGNSIDPYLGLEYTRPALRPEGTGFLAEWGWYGSLEARYRSVYDYHRTSAGVAEDRQLSANLIVGAQKLGGQFTRVSPFVRVYQGVNPHGQFRNQRDFTLVGLGFRVAR